MHLLLMIPSSLLLLLLFLHSWHYRGRRVTLVFFGACFAFGVLRGNTIYHIITNLLGGSSLPYLMVQPVVKIWQASIQECVGWIFALYLSWCVAERILTRGGSDRVPLFRLIGMASLLMGAVAYAVEAAAAAVHWWVWTIPIRNPFYADVPFAGIIAWISVGVDFLGVFLILWHGGYATRWKWLLVLIFPVHMALHVKVDNMSSWLPMNPAELWHWLMLCAIFLGIVAGGPMVKTLLGTEERGPEKTLPRYTVPVVLGGFLLTLAVVNFVLVRDPFLWISLLPFVTIVLFVRPLWAAGFCVASCLAYGLLVSDWSYILVPLIVLAVFGAVTPPLEDKLPARLRFRSTVAVLLVATVFVYLSYQERYRRYEQFTEISNELTTARTESGVAALMEKMPWPPKAGDSFHFNLLGARLNRIENYVAARAALERGIESDSTYSFLWINLGWSYANLQLYEKAVAAYEKALELNPIDTGSYTILGQLYEGRQRTGEAEELYRRGLSYRPSDTGLVLALESLLYRQQRTGEALDLLRKHLPDSGDPGKLAARMASGLFKMGRNEEAERWYKEVIHDGAKQMSASALSLAWIYWKDRGEMENALRYVRLAAAVNPTPEVYTMRGAILEEMGRSEEALEAYRQAAEAKAAGEASAGQR